MKKYITLAALLAAGTACANAVEINLLYGMDFNSGSDASYTNVATNPGSGSVVSQGSGYHNWVEGMDGTKASDVRGSSYYYEITSATDSSTGLGVNTKDGFTLSFNTYFASNDDWTSFLAFNIGGQDLVFQWGKKVSDTTKTSINVYTGGSDEALQGQQVGADDSRLYVDGLGASWYNVALVAKDDYLTLCVFDSSATLVGTTTLESRFTGSLNSVAGYTSYKFAKSYIDNLAIYDGALTEDQLAIVTKYEMENKTVMQSVPEPSAFGMLAGLGALALVASRRRRK